MNKMQEQVLEFHRTYGVPILPKPGIPSEERMRLRISLIEEEFEEFQEAWMDDNLIEMADALGDILWVVFGAAIEMGLDMEKVVDEIHRSNQTKLGADGKPIIREDGKILKGPNYRPPDISGVIQRL